MGKGGGRHSGNRSNWDEEIFDITKLLIQSYKIEKKQLVSESVSINDIWNDTNEIFKLIEENIEFKRKEKGLCCPPIRGLSVFMLPDMPE